MTSPHNQNPYGQGMPNNQGAPNGQGAPGGQNKRSKKTIILAAAGAILLLFVIAGIVGGGDGGNDKANTASSASTSASTSAASSATLSSAAATTTRERVMEDASDGSPTPGIRKAEPTVDMTAPMLNDPQAQSGRNGASNQGGGSGSAGRQQRNAVESANNYLSVMPFSDKGLRDQLAFDGYPQDAIDYAMNNISVDWNEQAVKKARQYDELMGMSDAALYDQLIFDGFTPEQAQYGVDHL